MTTGGVVLGIDLGSAWVGLVLAPNELPLRPRGVTLRVDPRDLGSTVATIAGMAKAEGVTRVVVEHSPGFYVPPDASPRQAAAMGEAYATCSRLLELVKAATRALGIPGETLPRASWSHRVVPHHKGGISDSVARAGVREHVAPESWTELHTQHEVDAAGAILGTIIPAPKRACRRRGRGDGKPVVVLTREQRKARRRLYLIAWKRTKRGVLERLTSGVCNCGPDGAPRVGRGRHKSTCVVAPPVKRKERKVDWWCRVMVPVRSDNHAPTCFNESANLDKAP